MAKDKESKEECCGGNRKWKHMNRAGAHSAVYGLGFLGALMYFLQHAPTFWLAVLGILKAIVWPALLIYRIFDLLKF